LPTPGGAAFNFHGKPTAIVAPCAAPAKALAEADRDWPDTEEIPKEKWEDAFKGLNDALITERNREWGAKEPKLSSDPEAAKLQQAGHDIPKTVGERVVKEHRRRKVAEMPRSSDKVQ